jgi:hypothetical protein
VRLPRDLGFGTIIGGVTQIHKGGVMTNLEEKNFAPIKAAFFEGLLQQLKIEVVRRFLTVPVCVDNGRVFKYGESDETVLLQEYADYINITEEDFLEKAKLLGVGCAVLYNALLKNASQVYGHKVVTDLLENENLKFNVVMNSAPTVVDPEALIRGWVSFRFYFASFNMPTSLNKGKTLLAVEKTYAAICSKLTRGSA